MQPWKAALGLGLACAACCAIPLLGGLAALVGATAALAATTAALWAGADEFVMPAAVLLVLAVAGGGLFWWRRRAADQAAAPSACSPGCGGDCGRG